MQIRPFWIWLIVVSSASSPALRAAEPVGTHAELSHQVQAILKQHCLECHGTDEPESQLNLTTNERLLYGSASGRILIPGDAAASLLLKLVAPESKPHMPPERQLTDSEIHTLSQWVNSLKPADLPARSSAGSAEHWAYQPPATHGPPPVQNTSWVRTPIDRFILAKLETVGLSPAPAADAATLCRRLYFDLIGLPPTPQEVDDFVRSQADPATAETAYTALVDALLASPHYGERWGRHWLDLARYADSSGFHDDLDRPYAWRYRDYVIQSFNDDKPYGQFISEQLAGDELTPEDATGWIATGFCRNGPTNDDNMGQGLMKEKYRLDLLDDVVATSSAVFLGQTIGCARCHDHKFDPIPQTDYYRLLAIFDNTKRVNVGLDEQGLPVEAIKAKKDDKNPAGPQPSIMALTDVGGKPRATHLLWRGDVANRGPEVEPGVPAAFTTVAYSLPNLSSDGRTTGRRLALAKWIASADNPLTWRVVANRIWQHHFGVGIVATPSNFGRTGAEPTHPELLDWLAQQMLARGGRWKPLHRLIVTSSVYRQSTRGVVSDVDPQNHWLSRMNCRRLEAEILRDAILAVSGTLNATVGGPGVKPRIRPELLVASQRNKWPVVNTEGPEHWRRSVYIYVKRQLPFPMLELFDAPSTAQTCERREESVVPTQALVLMNDEFTQQQAGFFADRVMQEASHDPQVQTATVLRLALNREPAADEVSEGAAFLRQQAEAQLRAGQSASEAARQALLDLCHVIFNSNEFAYVN